MEGKSILGTKGYNSLFALPLASVSCPSIQNDIQGKESSRNGTQVRISGTQINTIFYNGIQVKNWRTPPHQRGIP